MKALTLRPIALILSLFLSLQAAAKDEGISHFIDTPEGLKILRSALQQEVAEGFVDIEIPLEPIETVQSNKTRPWDEVIVSRNFSIIVPATPQTDEQKRLYDQLTEAQKETFQKRRLWIIKRMTQTLRLPNMALGVGLISGEKLGHLRQRIPTSEKMQKLNGRLIHPIKQLWKYVTRSKSNPDESADLSKNSPELGKPSDLAGQNNRKLAIMIHSINTTLWDSSPIWANATETGLELALGWQNQVLGPGRSHLLGLRMGVDFAKHNLVFETYTSPEQYKAGFVVNIGFIAKVLIYHRARGEEREISGTSIYPPIPNPIPFAGVGVEYGKNHVAAGWSASFPGDLVPIAGYVNDFKQKTLSLNVLKFKKDPHAPVDTTLQQTAEILSQSQNPMSDQTPLCEKTLDP